MNNLPTKLSRKAVTKIFDVITPSAWESLFKREDDNGLVKYRGNGDFPHRPYYSTKGVIQ